MSARQARRPIAGDDVNDAEPRIVSDDELERFQDFFYRKTGIIFGAAKRPFVERRLDLRMTARDVSSVRAYLSLLRFDDRSGEELQQLVNALTVNETYFYREPYQLRCLTSSILPELIARRAPARGGPVRIWSLPSSTGEEPYSLAMHLLEHWPDVDRYDVEIIGSDIDTRVLAHAGAGVYDDRSVQYLPAPMKQRYFTKVSSGRWQISETLRNSVEFSIVNINDRAAMGRHAGAFDLVFCRNMLIYFDDVSRRSAAEALFDSLRPGGFLCLGHSESMSRISSLFTLRKFPDAIVYQKPEK